MYVSKIKKYVFFIRWFYPHTSRYLVSPVDGIFREEDDLDNYEMNCQQCPIGNRQSLCELHY